MTKDDARFSRRRVLAGLVAVAAGGAAAAAVPPKETGLSTEGLLAGHAGFQPRTVTLLSTPVELRRGANIRSEPSFASAD